MAITCWLAGPHTRIFPVRAVPGSSALEIDVARGELVSFQIAATYSRERQAEPETVEASAFCRSASGMEPRIRRVGFVPVPHHNTDTPEEELDCRGHVPGYVPDPLFEPGPTRLASGETAAFWVSVKVPAEAVPGVVELPVGVSVDGREAPPLCARLRVWDASVPARRDLRVTHWFYVDALLDWYRLEGFDDGFWRILRPYVEDCVAHGQDTLYVPFLTPPLDGVKRPSQLLRVRKTAAAKGRRYRFDWTDVKRYVDLAKRAGIGHFEWTHFFTQWGAKTAVRVYEGQGRDEKLLWKPATAATSPTYRTFLSELLPELERFLAVEKLADRSFFHVSDEPHGEEHAASYRKARAVLAKMAPWMRSMDALSELRYGTEKLTDMPIPSISVTRSFVEAGIPCWTYFCCGPRGPWLNRLLDTPLAKIRMSGWLFRRFGVLGFLHWGYNYWYESQTRTLIDPYCESSGLRWPGWAYGDPFMVYPGPRGPVDSIRWEVFAASLADYALLEGAGVQPDDPLLADIRDFDEFPKAEAWWADARRAALARLAHR
jgi:hypothetical protein